MGLQTGPWDPVETKGGGQNRASPSAWGCLQLQQGSEEFPPCADTEPEPGSPIVEEGDCPRAWGELAICCPRNRQV